MTNGEKIRKLSDGELAVWLDNKLGSACPPGGRCKAADNSCPECWALWLSQEATDAD